MSGATSYSITFDANTRTENNYDFVTFYKDGACDEYYGSEKYSGRDGTSNWPGLDGNPPLAIDGPSFIAVMKSDNSNQDWGG